MNEKELRAIYQSDFKLWERAETVENEGRVTKTLFLPYGIGEFSLTLEGIKDAGTRRGAAEIWGQAVRDAIDNETSDESVTARAAQKAASAGTRDGQYGRLGGPNTNDAPTAPLSTTQTIQALSEPATISTEPSDRLDELRQLRTEYAQRMKGLDLEIKALQAYVEVMNAQEVSETPTVGASTEDTREVSSSTLPDGEPKSGQDSSFE